ncbi:MAG TPA: glycosyltransferase family 4 protein [Tepidisphaeraceae bacterium]|nr:glycosyltransferase family 4 protein [Tepidisphaeraceae bacterium]
MAKRALLLITDLELGGMPTVVRELASRLRDEVEVACLAPWGPVADQIRDGGVEVTALGATGPADVAVIGRLIHLIRARRFETVLSFLVHANTVAAISSWFCPEVRFIQSIHTAQPYPKWHWIVQGIVYHFAHKVIVPSQSVANVLHDWSAVPWDKVQIIPNGQSMVEIAPQRVLFRPQIVVGFLGRLDPIKRLTDLVRAMTFLDDRFELNIFGEGQDRTNIEREITQLGLANRVKLFGATDKPQSAIETMDLLVLCSQAEGFGLALTEAMAAGVPVIGTDVPGIRDVIRHEETGLLVPVGEPGKLARAIERMASSESMRKQLIENALIDVRRRYDWNVVLPQYRRILGLDD